MLTIWESGIQENHSPLAEPGKTSGGLFLHPCRPDCGLTSCELEQIVETHLLCWSQALPCFFKKCSLQSVQGRRVGGLLCHRAGRFKNLPNDHFHINFTLSPSQKGGNESHLLVNQNSPHLYLTGEEQ